MKRILILCMLLLCLTGCWDQMELNQISLVTGMGLDRGEKHRYKLSIEALNAAEYSKGQSKSGVSNSVVVSIEGNSMHEILERIHTKIARELVFSHMQLFVVSEEVARNGFNDVLDWLERSRQARNRLQFAIAKDATALDLLKTTYPIQMVSTLKLRKQIHSASVNWALSPEVHLRELTNSFILPGKQAVLPVLTLRGNREQVGGEQKSAAPEPIVTISNLAVFKRDKLIGFLSLHDAKSYMWLTDGIERDEVAVLCKRHTKKSFIARLYDTHASVQAEYRGNTPHFHIWITQEGRIDNSECDAPLSKSGTFTHFDALVSQKVAEQVKDTITKVQRQYKSDIFGFGEHMYRQQYATFKHIKDWDKEFARATFTIEVNTNLVRSGIRTNSFIHDIK